MTGEPRSLDVLSVGELLLDFIAPDAEDLAAAEVFLRVPGGAPANVAVAVSRLGGRAAFAGAVGDDAFGRYLRSVLQEEGVETSGVKTLTQRTTLAFVARNAGGIPDFLFYRGADAELQPEDIPTGLLAETRFLYVGSMALLTEPSSSATQFAVEIARESGTLVAVDPNLRPSSWPSLDAARAAILPLARAADVLKLNEEEARLLANTVDLDEAIAALSAEAGFVVVTMGPEGCRWQAGDRSGNVSAPRVRVRDTTGAGDAFVGALLAGLAREGIELAATTPLDMTALESVLAFACAAGAHACTRPGAMSALPTCQEVEALLEKTDG